MKKVKLPVVRNYQNNFALILVFFILLGCQSVDSQPVERSNNLQRNLNLEEKRFALTAREYELIAREAAISAREAELVTLFSELLKQQKVLEKSQSNLARQKKNTVVTQTESTANSSKNNSDKKDNRVVLGSLENIYLDPPGMEFSARVDTGAQTSSLNAIDMVEFERDGKPYIKFHVIDPKTGEKIELTRHIRGYVRIKKHNKKSQRRPIVKLRVMLANIDEQINFTLIDRSKFKYQVLIGRNFLRDLAIVDVSKQYIAPKIDHKNGKSK